MFPKQQTLPAINWRQFAEHIPLLELLDDGCTITSSVDKELFLVQVIRLQGVDMQSCSSKQQAHYHQRIKMICNTMSSKVTYSFFTDRGHRQVKKETRVRYGNAYAQSVAEVFNNHSTNYIATTTHMVIVYSLGKVIAHMLALVSANYHREHATIARHVKELHHIRKELCQSLAVFDPTTLTQQELLEFWASHINGGEHITMPKTAKSLDKLMAMSEVSFVPHARHVCFYFAHKKSFSAYLSINIYIKTFINSF